MKKADIIKILNNYRTVTDVIQWVEFDSIAVDIISAQSKECHCGGYPDCICEITKKLDMKSNQGIVDAALELASKKCGKPKRKGRYIPKVKICAACGSFAHGNPGHDI